MSSCDAKGMLLLWAIYAQSAFLDMQGKVKDCIEYANQLNQLFPDHPGNEWPAICLLGDTEPPGIRMSDNGLYVFGLSGLEAATHLAAWVENDPSVNITTNWTLARVNQVEHYHNRTSAVCPCKPLFSCTGRLGNVSTCRPVPLPQPDKCFDGASATCESLISGGISAAVGGLISGFVWR